MFVLMISVKDWDVELKPFIFLSQTDLYCIDFTFDKVNIFNIKLVFPCLEVFVYFLECWLEVNIGWFHGY